MQAAAQLEAAQQPEVSEAVSAKASPTTWATLPPLVLYVVYSYFPQKDLLSIANVNKHWFRCVKNTEMLWREVDLNMFPRLHSMDDVLRFLRLTLSRRSWSPQDTVLPRYYQ